MSAASIRAARAYVEMFLDDNPLIRGLNQTSAKLKAWGASLSSIGKKMAGFGIAATAVLFAAAKAAADSGSALLEMSQRTGFSVESLDTMSFALEQAGTDLAAFESGIRKMQSTLTDAAQKGGASAAAFQALGLSIKFLQSLSPEAQFLAIADALSKVQDPAKKAALAMDIFGKSGTLLLPSLANGVAGLQAVRAEWQRFAMTTDEATAVEEFGDELNKLWMTLKKTVAVVGQAVIPVFREWIAVAQQALMPVLEWLKANPQMAASLVTLAGATSAAGSFLAVFGDAMKGLGMILGTIPVAIGLVGSALAALASPIGIVVGIIAAAGGAWATWHDQGNAAIDGIKTNLGTVAGAAQAAFGGVFDAIRANDWSLAGDVAMAGLTVAWEAGVATLKEIWYRMQTSISTAFVSFVAELMATIQRFVNEFIQVYRNFAQFFSTGEWREDASFDQDLVDAVEDWRRGGREVNKDIEASQERKIEDARKPVEEAKKRLQDLVDQSAKAAEDVAKGAAGAISQSVEKGWEEGYQHIANAPDPWAKYASALVRGTQEAADAALAQRFGNPEPGQKVEEKQLDEQKRTNKKLDDVNRNLRNATVVKSSKMS